MVAIRDADKDLAVFCVHTTDPFADGCTAKKVHAAESMLSDYGIDARCVVLECYDDGRPWDITRQRAHLRAIKSAEEESVRVAIFVEAGVAPDRSPVEEAVGPPGLAWEMLCMSGSVTHMDMFHEGESRESELNASSEEPEELFEVPRKAAEVAEKLEGRKSALFAVAGVESIDAGCCAVVRDSSVVALRLTPGMFGALLSRGDIQDSESLLDDIYDRLIEVTHVKTVVRGAPRRPGMQALMRRKWVHGLPTTLSCYALSAAGVQKAIDLLEYTIDKSPLPNVLAYEKHVRGRIRCYVSLDPLTSTKFEPLVDYIHLLSGLRNYPLNRKPRQIRSAVMDATGTKVFLGTLPESELPKVSVITITRNRRRIFNVAVFMFMRFEYPKDRLEWVIVDDSEEGQDAYPSLGALRDDPRVVYRRLKTENGKPFRIGHKREIACQMATGDVFFHLDDDDFAPPLAVMVRTRALLEYKAKCVGATYMLSYVHSSGRTFFTTVADVYGDLVCFGEPTLAYTRGFWESRRWNAGVHFDEGRYFLLGRNYDDFVNVPSHFHCVALTHKSNVTGSLRDGSDVADCAATHFKADEIFPEELVRLMKHAFAKK